MDYCWLCSLCCSKNFGLLETIHGCQALVPEWSPIFVPAILAQCVSEVVECIDQWGQDDNWIDHPWYRLPVVTSRIPGNKVHVFVPLYLESNWQIIRHPVSIDWGGLFCFLWVNHMIKVKILTTCKFWNGEAYGKFNNTVRLEFPSGFKLEIPDGDYINSELLNSKNCYHL